VPENTLFLRGVRRLLGAMRRSTGMITQGLEAAFMPTHCKVGASFMMPCTLGHHKGCPYLAQVSARLRSMSQLDVAPGSWCPMLRSPR
jgi:hypothetical protein